MPTTQKGVAVDKDAEPLREPVTVLVSPGGNEYEADSWSEANNLIATGCKIKDGHPTGPAAATPSAPSRRSGGPGSSSPNGKSTETATS